MNLFPPVLQNQVWSFRELPSVLKDRMDWRVVQTNPLQLTIGYCTNICVLISFQQTKKRTHRCRRKVNVASENIYVRVFNQDILDYWMFEQDIVCFVMFWTVISFQPQMKMLVNVMTADEFNLKKICLFHNGFFLFYSHATMSSIAVMFV